MAEQQQPISDLPHLPTPELQLRRATARDEAFVFDGWLQSNRGLATRLHAPMELYYHHQREQVMKLWSDGGVTWLVACMPKDPEFIYGWLCGEGSDAGPVLHYVYTKQSARRLGVATALLGAFLHGQDVAGAKLWCTHWTADWWRCTRDGNYQGLLVVTDPWLLWNRGVAA